MSYAELVHYQRALFWLMAARQGATFADAIQPRPPALRIANTIDALSHHPEAQSVLLDWVSGYPIAQQEETP